MSNVDRVNLLSDGRRLIIFGELGETSLSKGNLTGHLYKIKKTFRGTVARTICQLKEKGRRRVKLIASKKIFSSGSTLENFSPRSVNAFLE
ncbi:MAG: hypothetical protein PUP92_15025 [Rhizonema sp. PD38]|nr:hypothetical protein [Rhizonema sp. PD38]